MWKDSFIGIWAWRLGRESKGSKEKKETGTRNSNNNNVKSNNHNAHIEGDTTVNSNTYKYYYNVFPNMRLPGPSSNSPSAPLSSDSVTVPEREGRKTPTSSFTEDLRNSSQSTIRISSAVNPEGSANGPPPSMHPTLPLISPSASYQSQRFSGVEFPLPEAITLEQMKRLMPEYTPKHIRIYMSAMLFGSKRIIPLWNPSPSIKTNPQKWKLYVYIGDVGTFNDQGAFDTLFNIFLSPEQNVEHGYTPPHGFIPYRKNLKEVKIDFRDVMLTTPLRSIGLTSNGCQIGSSFHTTAAECSALYLNSGYLSVSLNQYERPGIREYIRGHQESWQLHLKDETSGQMQDRPLLVIYSSFRAKSCALAAGSKPGWLKSWKAKLTLQELARGNHRSYVLEADDQNIFTHFSPSHASVENLEAFFRDLGAKYSADDRKEIEGCHCVAVGAYSVQKRGWIKGGSAITGKSSGMAVKPRWSRMTLPAHFNQSIREEIGH